MVKYSGTHPITNADLAVLGLIAEGPRHGYQVDQDIASRGIRDWTEIGFSSIYYVLNKLEGAGWLESRLEEDELPSNRGPARKIYSLTAAGQDNYRAAVRQRLASPRPRTADFSLGLANLPALPPADAQSAIEKHRTELSDKLQKILEKKQNDFRLAGFLPPHVVALFSYSEAQMTAELDWLTDFLSAGIF